MSTGDVEIPVLEEDTKLNNKRKGSKTEYGSFGQDTDNQDLIEGFSKSVMEFGIDDLKLAYSRRQNDISHINFYKVSIFILVILCFVMKCTLFCVAIATANINIPNNVQQNIYSI